MIERPTTFIGFFVVVLTGFALGLGFAVANWALSFLGHGHAF
jgi:hypothetical protein